MERLDQNVPSENVSESRVAVAKQRLREEVWRILEEENLARFPRTAYNRIPNFVGSEKAAFVITKLKEFSEARVVKFNPDSPQIHVRKIFLEEGKTLLMPTPRLSARFLKLEPKRIEGDQLGKPFPFQEPLGSLRRSHSLGSLLSI